MFCLQILIGRSGQTYVKHKHIWLVIPHLLSVIPVGKLSSVAKEGGKVIWIDQWQCSLNKIVHCTTLKIIQASTGYPCGYANEIKFKF